MIIAYGMVGLVAILYFTGMKDTHTEIYIDATPEQVWSVITATDKYSEWNTVFELLDGDIVEGNKVEYRFHSKPEKDENIKAKVIAKKEHKLLNQRGGIPLIVTFNHNYILEHSSGGTKLIIHEDYKGLMVHFWSQKEVQQAYERLAKEIKNRAESLYSSHERYS